MTKDELDAIRARHADCEPERCEDVHLLLAELDRFLCQCDHWLDEHHENYDGVLECWATDCRCFIFEVEGAPETVASLLLPPRNH